MKGIDIDDVVEAITVESICVGKEFDVWSFSNCDCDDCNLCWEKFLREVFTPSEAPTPDAGLVARVEALEAFIADMCDAFGRYGMTAAVAKVAHEKGGRVVNENREHEGSEQ